MLIYISSGLFLGWLLGKNDTVNVFGSSVSSRMLNFRLAAFIASFFIIAGAVFQGSGTTASLNRLGNVADPVIAFSIALSASIVVLILIRMKLPVSTSQSIVGSIIGWSLFIKAKADWSLLSDFIISWILAPIIGLLLGMLFYVIMRWFLKRSRIHLIKLDTYLRIALVIAISLSAFGLGANNIGNVTGIFSNLAPQIQIDFGLFRIDGLGLLFLIGGVSIATGVYNYNWNSGTGSGEGILSLAPESTLVVLFSQASVLFMFSSTWLANLLKSAGIHPIPLVPISSTQIIIGAVIGIGIIKGAREIEFKTIASIGLGWITAPLLAALLTYSFLFLLREVFQINIIAETSEFIFKNSIDKHKEPGLNINLIIPSAVFLSILIIIMFIVLFFRQQKIRMKIEKDMLIQQNQLYLSEKALNELEMRTISIENEALSTKLQAKRKEFMDIALNINEQREFLEKINQNINDIIKINQNDERTEKLKDLSLLIKQRMSFSQEKKDFYVRIEDIHKDFHMKIKTIFPQLTELEKRLAGLIRLNLTSKEISSLLNISPKSVEVAKYRLKKKLKIEKEANLRSFINNI
ncbi:MAG: inorganic phosphate transporter [Bacteroidales bacterium]